eukprot:CAMPEP_0117672738 /NCGR_PEP_ID=MMETSP0804-20121206/14077_1 /TAXON_ID=1074897 /ORGANISM="Tetraselmis astigmatica, Strain CCMP880" /LENGTH=83 /DNA_ID=CAMNT_0005481385 /DNA_START=324 /DNA_END=575 /DNA_ORIENTATION=-
MVLRVSLEPSPSARQPLPEPPDGFLGVLSRAAVGEAHKLVALLRVEVHPRSCCHTCMKEHLLAELARVAGEVADICVDVECAV